MKHPILWLLAGLTALGPAYALDVTNAMLAADAKDTKSVLSFGMGTEGQRYSPLTNINTRNVRQLVPAWSFSFGGEKQRGQESQPLIHNGKMFVTASYSRIFAVDLKTGAKLWKYEHRLPDGIMPCCDVVNRGAALYGNLVIFGTLDAQLVALDQETGKVVWKEKVDDYAAGYSMTAAPLIANGMLMTGVSGGEFGVVGRVEARNPMTGELLWMRPTVEGHMGYRYDKEGKAIENGVTGTVNKSWPGDLWKTGGASTWMGGTYDASTGLAYFGTGNPAPWNSHLRPGDNLYSSSTVALDPKTGQIKWAYQNTPNDSWDFDGANEFVTFDMNGKRYGGKADRNGFFYVIDAKDGKLQNAFPFVRKITWASSIDLKTGRPNFIAANRPSDPTKGNGDGKKGSTVFSAPAFLGAKNQMPMAYSPQTGLFYVPANLERADLVQEGRRLPRRRLHHQAAERRLHRRPARGRPEDRQDRLGSEEHRAALGRRDDHRRRPGLLRHARRLSESARRQDRQGVVEVPDRLRRGGAAGHLGRGRRAVHRGRLGLGRRGAAVGRRSGEEGQLPRTGWFGLGLQAADPDLMACAADLQRPRPMWCLCRRPRLPAFFAHS